MAATAARNMYPPWVNKCTPHGWFMKSGSIHLSLSPSLSSSFPPAAPYRYEQQQFCIFPFFSKDPYLSICTSTLGVILSFFLSPMLISIEIERYKIAYVGRCRHLPCYENTFARAFHLQFHFPLLSPPLSLPFSSHAHNPQSQIL